MCSFLKERNESKVGSLFISRPHRILAIVIVPESNLRRRRKFNGGGPVSLATALPNVDEADVTMSAEVVPQGVRSFLRADVSDKD